MTADKILAGEKGKEMKHSLLKNTYMKMLQRAPGLVYRNIKTAARRSDGGGTDQTTQQSAAKKPLAGSVGWIVWGVVSPGCCAPRLKELVEKRRRRAMHSMGLAVGFGCAR